MRPSDEQGFTLVELLVAIFLFSILSVGFYQVMFSTVRGSNEASDVSEVAEEARLGFNRMIRDTREATRLIVAEDDRYRIWTDFNSDDDVDEADYEYLEYEYEAGAIYLSALEGPPAGDPDLIDGTEAVLAGTERETLAANIQPIGTNPIFTYVSNFLIYDANGNGETSVTELGDGDAVLEGVELSYISDINYAFSVSVGGNSRRFYGQAQIRNRRFSDL